jgi:hypothetical protein
VGVKEMGKQMMMYGADTQLERLTKLGDSLEKINAAIDWEIFHKPKRKPNGLTKADKEARKSDDNPRRRRLKTRKGSPVTGGAFSIALLDYLISRFFTI